MKLWDILRRKKGSSPKELSAAEKDRLSRKPTSGFMQKVGSLFDFGELIFGKQEPVGLDIGSSSVKLAEISERKSRIVLHRYYQIPIERGIIVDGVVADIEKLAEKIKVLFRDSGCRRKTVSTAIPGRSVIIKKVSFPHLTDDELRKIIKEESIKYLPFESMEGVYFDFQVLGENPYNSNLSDVIIVAAKDEVVDAYLEAIRIAGLTPVVLDVDTFALETMYEKNYDYDEDEVVAIVNIGASFTNINILKNATSMFTRDISLGGNSITESIEREYGVTFEEAERIKIDGFKDDESVRENLLSYADLICSEIERSLDYFHSLHGGEDIRRVLLAGGGAMIPRLPEYLEERLRIQTELVNPLRKLVYNDRVITQEYVQRNVTCAAVAIGLAFRRPGDKWSA
ncbi:MAG: pilus assembly protein PilM [Syntrophales bacterium]|nr:pilus assembly protein PilM [Syntrophales bacterium]